MFHHFANQQRLTNSIWDINGDQNEFISFIWISFLKSFPIINQSIYWTISWGTQVFIGFDPFIGLCEYYRLSYRLVEELHKRNIFGVGKGTWFPYGDFFGLLGEWDSPLF